MESDIFNFTSFIEFKKVEYARLIVKSLEETLHIDDAIEFVNILMLYSHSEHSKKHVLKEFDFFTNHIVSNYIPTISTTIISFLISVLKVNDIITEYEADYMKKVFLENIR